MVTSPTEKRRKATASAITLVAVGSVAAAALLLSGAVGSDEIARTPAAVVSELQSERQPEDVLPRAANPDVFAEVADSTRLLAEDKTATYYVATNRAGEICIIAAITGTSNVAASCGPIDLFLQRGEAIAFTDEETGTHVEAYLVPDGVELSDPAVDPLVKLAPNLLVGDTRGLTAEKTRLASKSDVVEQFTLELLSPPTETKG